MGVKVVGRGADFRLRDPCVYERWYGGAHVGPDLLDRCAYGLPELTRDHIGKVDAVASAGCYPTAAAPALAPGWPSIAGAKPSVMRRTKLVTA